MKRYSIVRVDNNCPDLFENIHSKFVCEIEIGRDCKVSCKNCRYGDTKEQLIKKIATVFSMEKIIVAKDLNEYKYKLAKEIVEFLGVEE